MTDKKIRKLLSTMSTIELRSNLFTEIKTTQYYEDRIIQLQKELFYFHQEQNAKRENTLALLGINKEALAKAKEIFNTIEDKNLVKEAERILMGKA